MSKLNRTQFTLTRFLYIKDEVVFSMLLSLTEKNDIHATLFWAYELYYSGFQEELFDYIRRIYFDFYALLHPSFYRFIDKQYELWLTTHDDSIVGYIIKNLFLMQPSYTIFALRQNLLNGYESKTTFRGRRPIWLDKYTPIYHKLLRSIHTRSYQDICYYLYRLKDTELDIGLLEIGKYFEQEEKIFIAPEFYISSDDHMTYKDKHHVWLNVIFHLMNYVVSNDHDVNAQKKILVVKLSDPELQSIRTIETESIEPKYKTLEKKRLYKIHPDIGYFQMSRKNMITSYGLKFVDEIQQHWLYYVYQTPRYHRILSEQYENIVVNDELRKIEFANEDDYENFYETYGYFDPDEQSKETQDKVFQYNTEERNIGLFIQEPRLNITYLLTHRIIY